MKAGYDMLPQQYSPEHEPREVDTFVVLDLDQTMLDSYALVDAMCLLLTKHSISDMDARSEIEYICSHAGKSMQAVDYLSAKYGSDTVAAIKSELVVSAESGELDVLLFPGVIELLDQLDTREIPFGILTYGNEENQNFKLQLFRAITERNEVTLPSEVTKVKSKGQSIHDEWQHEGVDGFDVSESFTHDRPIHAKHIVVVDDKINHLVIDNPNIRGFLVNNGDDGMPGQPVIEFTELVRSFESDDSLWAVAA